MTITTNLSSGHGEEKKFSSRPAGPRIQTLLTLLTGAGLAAYGASRRDWLGAALAGGGGYLLYGGAHELRRPYRGSLRVAFTIAKGRQEIYDFVHNSQNWNLFLHGIQLLSRGAGRFALRPANASDASVVSKAEITDEKPAEHIAWASSKQAFEHRGVMHFKDAPGDRGTEVSIALEYKAPAGPVTRALVALFGWDPERIVRESLRHLKQILEAGEIPTTLGQPVGARGAKGAAMRILFREPVLERAPEQVPLAGD
jgi:uncharacterized membrane protein